MHRWALSSTWITAEVIFSSPYTFLLPRKLFQRLDFFAFLGDIAPSSTRLLPPSCLRLSNRFNHQPDGHQHPLAPRSGHLSASEYCDLSFGLRLGIFFVLNIIVDRVRVQFVLANSPLTPLCSVCKISNSALIISCLLFPFTYSIPSIRRSAGF